MSENHTNTDGYQSVDLPVIPDREPYPRNTPVLLSRDETETILETLSYLLGEVRRLRVLSGRSKDNQPAFQEAIYEIRKRIE